MGDEPKFEYGETVRITAKEHKGRIGAVVGISGQECSRTYTVEFGDGSDSEIAEELLSKCESDARKMDKLLARIAEAGDEEDILIRFTDASWPGKSLQLHLALTVLDSAQETWEVRCEDVLAYLLRNESANWLELTAEHPLLWEFKQESASAYFYQAPVNVHAAVGVLYEAHQNAVGSWIRFGQHLNSPPGLSKLLAAGNGLLAQGPVPLLTLYKETLRPLGVEVDIRFSRPPQTWDGTHWRQLSRENGTKALLLGTSYVIGNGWSAAQIA